MRNGTCGMHVIGRSISHLMLPQLLIECGNHVRKYNLGLYVINVMFCMLLDVCYVFLVNVIAFPLMFLDVYTQFFLLLLSHSRVQSRNSRVSIETLGFARQLRSVQLL